MPYHATPEAEARLAAETPALTEREIEELLPWMRSMGIGPVQRLQAELTFTSVKAVRDFERSSNRVAKWMIGLVVSQVVLAVVQVALIVYRNR